MTFTSDEVVNLIASALKVYDTMKSKVGRTYITSREAWLRYGKANVSKWDQQNKLRKEVSGWERKRVKYLVVDLETQMQALLASNKINDGRC